MSESVPVWKRNDDTITTLAGALRLTRRSRFLCFGGHIHTWLTNASVSMHICTRRHLCSPPLHLWRDYTVSAYKIPIISSSVKAKASVTQIPAPPCVPRTRHLTHTERWRGAEKGGNLQTLNTGVFGITCGIILSSWLLLCIGCYIKMHKQDSVPVVSARGGGSIYILSCRRWEEPYKTMGCVY